MQTLNMNEKVLQCHKQQHSKITERDAVPKPALVWRSKFTPLKARQDYLVRDVLTEAVASLPNINAR